SERSSSLACAGNGRPRGGASSASTDAVRIVASARCNSAPSFVGRTHTTIVAASMQPRELPSAGQRFGPGVLLARVRTSQGVRAGAVLSLATLVLNGATYVYYIACIRYL